MTSNGSHGPESGRVHRIAKAYADARERAAMARSQGDDSGARYAAAEAARYRRILAEG
jgi:hypothetical protein